MSELRQDPVSGRWVIVAPNRARRPNTASRPAGFATDAPDPFAEGCEAETPGELLAYRQPGTAPDTPGWSVRVVPNKYPAVSSGGEFQEDLDPLHRTASGVGAHEVLVESPHMETCLSRLSAEQVRNVFRCYRDRLLFHRQQRTCAHAMVFKNKGVQGGATLAHSHAQLIASPWIPTAITTELQHCRDYWQTYGRNLFADLLEREIASGERLVAVTERLVAWCPFASRVPGETWVIPRHAADVFETETDDVIAACGELVQNLLQRLDRLWADVPYNFVIHSSPCSLPTQPWYRWHLEILPRIGSTAGFEWGGGVFINALPPEEAAQQLRAAQR